MHYHYRFSSICIVLFHYKYLFNVNSQDTLHLFSKCFLEYSSTTPYLCTKSQLQNFFHSSIQNLLKLKGSPKSSCQKCILSLRCRRRPQASSYSDRGGKVGHPVFSSRWQNVLKIVHFFMGHVMHPSYIWPLVMHSYFSAHVSNTRIAKLYFYEYWYFPGYLSNVALPRLTQVAKNYIQRYHSSCVFLFDFTEQRYLMSHFKSNKASNTCLFGLLGLGLFSFFR